MKDLTELMNQAKNLESRLKEVQAEVEQAEVHGEAGAGLVTVVLGGRNNVKSIRIDPSLMKEEEREVLEDLLIAALNDARSRLEQQLAKKMESVTAGLSLGSLPGFPS